jgi:hypothetical protein
LPAEYPFKPPSFMLLTVLTMENTFLKPFFLILFGNFYRANGFFELFVIVLGFFFGSQMGVLKRRQRYA